MVDGADAGLKAALTPADRTTAPDGRFSEHACLNCGSSLDGAYCRDCGQAAHVHRTIGAFFHDLLHGVFHFEGKVWRTVPLLVLHPGRLTRAYIDGQRASHVSPIALFLFSVFLLFAVMRVVMGDGSVMASVDVAVADHRTGIAGLEAERRQVAGRREDTAAIDAQLVSERDDLAVLERLRARGTDTAPAQVDTWGTVKADVPALDAAIKRAQANPDLLIYRLQTDAYKYSWALIPLSVPFVWLLFAWRRRFGLYDHTVFVTYSLCFMTLLMVVVSVLGWAGVPIAGTLGALVPPVHMYRQLRGTYSLTRFGAAWRAVALSAIALLALAVFGIALVALEIA